MVRKHGDMQSQIASLKKVTKDANKDREKLLSELENY